MPSRPIRLSRSTSATSPSRAAPSSRAARPRRISPPSSAVISTARPCSKRTTSPLTIGPSNSASGLVDATTPSVRAGSGDVNTSSEGRFAMCRMPSTVSPPAVSHWASGKRPTTRSVPGPSKWSASSPASPEPPRDVVQLLPSRRPGRDRVRLVEAAHVPDLVPQAFEGLGARQLGVDELRPVEGRRQARPSS